MNGPAVLHFTHFTLENGPVTVILVDARELRPSQTYKTVEF